MASSPGPKRAERSQTSYVNAVDLELNGAIARDATEINNESENVHKSLHFINHLTYPAIGVVANAFKFVMGAKNFVLIRPIREVCGTKISVQNRQSIFNSFAYS